MSTNSLNRLGITSLNAMRMSYLATLAIVSQVVLNAVAWLLPLVSEYRFVEDNISELVLGDYGFVQSAAFLIAGLGTLGLAVVIRMMTAGIWGSFAGSLLVGAYGLGALIMPLFPTDRIDESGDVWSSSTTGSIHIIVAFIAFLSLMIAMFVLTRTFRRHDAWRSIALASGVLAGASLALLFVQSEGPIVGLLQRLLVLVNSAWIVIVALRARAIVSKRLPSASRPV